MPTIKMKGQRFGRDKMNEIAHKNVKVVTEQNMPKPEADWRDSIISNCKTTYIHHISEKLKEDSRKLKGVVARTRWGDIYQLDEMFWSIDDFYSVSNLPVANLSERNRNFAYGMTPTIADENEAKMLSTSKSLITIKPQVDTTRDGAKKHILSFFALAPKINEQDYKNLKKESVNYTYLPNIYRIDIITIPNSNYHRMRLSAVAGGYAGADCPLVQLELNANGQWEKYTYRSSHTNTKVDKFNPEIGCKILDDVQSFEDACKYIFELANVNSYLADRQTNNIRELIKTLPSCEKDLEEFSGEMVPAFFDRVWGKPAQSEATSESGDNAIAGDVTTNDVAASNGSAIINENVATSDGAGITDGIVDDSGAVGDAEPLDTATPASNTANSADLNGGTEKTI